MVLSLECGNMRDVAKLSVTVLCLRLVPARQSELGKTFLLEKLLCLDCFHFEMVIQHHVVYLCL